MSCRVGVQIRCNATVRVEYIGSRSKNTMPFQTEGQEAAEAVLEAYLATLLVESQDLVDPISSSSSSGSSSGSSDDSECQHFMF